MNAKDEFLDKIKNKHSVSCAYIKFDRYWDEKKVKVFKLKPGYTEEDYNAFLKSLDFEYDDGYGSQELYGYVWFTNDSWLERHEYDGSECWHFKKTPELPKELL